LARRTASLSRCYTISAARKPDAAHFVEILTPVDIFLDENESRDGASTADNLLAGRHAHGALSALAAAHDLAIHSRARVDHAKPAMTALQALETE
jgi:hypothetical protein